MSEYDLTISPAVDTPERQIEGFVVTTSGRVNYGDSFEVTATFPEFTTDYVIEIRNTSEEIDYFRQPINEDGTHQIHSADIDSPVGSYVVILYNNDEEDPDDPRALEPLVVQAYEATLEAPSVYEPDRTVDVTVELDPIDGTDVSLRVTDLRIWNDETETQVYMDEVDELTYTASLTDLPDPPFYMQAAPSKDSDGDDLDVEPVAFTDRVTVDALPETLTVTRTASLQATIGPVQAMSPAVDSDHVYVGGLGTEPAATPVLALPRETDWDEVSPAWSFDREGSLVESSPVLDPSGDRLYIGSGGGILYALDSADPGEQADWTVSTGSAIAATPVSTDNAVYVGTTAGTVYKVDAETGDEEWSSSLSGPVYRSVALHPATEQVFVTTATGQLVALAESTGDVQWSESVPAPQWPSAPVVQDDVVYVAGEKLHAYDVTVDNGDRTVWDDPYPLAAPAQATPVVDSLVIVPDSSGIVHGLDAATGSAEWTYEAIDGVVSTPARFADRVCFSTTTGRVYLLDVEEGSPRAVADLDTSVAAKPAVLDSTVYVTTEAGEIVELDVE